MNGSEQCVFTTPVNAETAVTVFVAWSATNVTNSNDFISSTHNNSFVYRISSAQQQAVLANVALLTPQGTATLSNSTFYQTYVSYDATTLAFGKGTGSDGSGSQTAVISFTTELAFNASGSEQFTGTVARMDVFIGSVVVNSTNITAMQNAYHAYYGL